jgi:hypothetical protein
MRAHLFSWLLVLVVPVPLAAQVTRPTTINKYDVHFRYRIRTDRDERIRQFRAMEADLKQLGFTPAKRPDADLDVFDPNAEILNGTIGSDTAFKLVNLPNIKTVVLLPAGTPLPADPKQLVQVRLGIATGLPASIQHDLHVQVVKHLKLLGFSENVAYHHAEYSSIRGALPAGKVLSLLKDLRSLPAGWLFPEVRSDELPSPLSRVLPIRLVEVLPDFPENQPIQEPANLGKLSPEVLTLATDPKTADQPVYIEVVLDEEITTVSRDIRSRLRSSTGGTVEGLSGTAALVRLPKASGILKLTQAEVVRHVRLPGVAHETARTVKETPDVPKPAQVLAKTNLALLHAENYRGAGRRIVILASEFPDLTAVKEETPKFPGFVEVKGSQIPRAYFLDLTPEMVPNVQPRPAQPERASTGTATASATAAAAPEATLFLVRIDPGAFHQLATVIRAINGSVSYSTGLQSRIEESSIESELLAARRRTVVEQYRKAFMDLSDEGKAPMLREEAAAAMKALQASEAEFKAKVDRFMTVKQGLESLRGANVVVNTLVWEAGYAQDGLSSVSRLIDETFSSAVAKSAIKPDKNPPPPVWIQAASSAVGQIWAGPFRDDDANGVLEFAPSTTALAKNRWTRELNFLKYLPTNGETTPVLPAGTKLRISLQWREPHNRNAYLNSEPVYPLRLRLLKQVDPEAQAHSTDDFIEVGRSMGLPVRLLKTPGSGTYEVTIETTLAADGVYALRVEGTNQLNDTLSAIRQGVEFHPRIAIQLPIPAQAAAGTVMFDTFAPRNVGVGIPADASEAVAVGGGSAKQPTSLTGAGPGIALRSKPEVYTTSIITVDGKTLEGPAIAAGYAAGMAACLGEAGVRKTDVTRTMGLNPGDDLVLPQEWIQSLPRRKPEISER